MNQTNEGALELKEAVASEVAQQIHSKIDQLAKEIGALQQDRLGESKSSAGDKHETGRAMMDLELERLEVQMMKTKRALAELNSLSFGPSVCAEPGALVVTNHHHFMLAIPWGKLHIMNRDVWVISIVSPMGQAMLHLKPSDVFEVNGTLHEILSIH